MAAEIARELPDVQVDLKGGGRGDFLVTAGQDLVWDKRNRENVFPENATIVERLRSLT